MARKRKAPTQPRVARITKWVAPENDTLKLNVDGAVFNVSNQTSMGVVVRNSIGVGKYARSVVFPGLVTSLEAEFRGLFHALKWIRALQLKDVDIESDLQLMLQMLHNPIEHRRDEIGVLARSCKLILSQLHNVRIRHIHRGGNKAAHALARFSRTLGGDNVWYNLTPAHVAEVVAADCRS